MTTATATKVHTQAGPGFTYFARWMGRCKSCKQLIKVEYPIDGPRPAGFFYTDVKRCECGQSVNLTIVTGTHSDKVCNDRCMGATGPSCECSCGGENHGGR